TVEELRRARPDLALSSDFIVGFPGESEDDFRATLDLVGEIGYAQAFSFKYSPRPGTPAAGAPDQIPEPIKSERLAALQELLTQQQRAFNRSCVGQVLPVLFEKPGRYPAGDRRAGIGHRGGAAGADPALRSAEAGPRDRRRRSRGGAASGAGRDRG